MKPAAEMSEQSRLAENEKLRAKLLCEIQEFSHRLKELHELQSLDKALQPLMVKSYKQMIETRQVLLGLIPPSSQVMAS